MNKSDLINALVEKTEFSVKDATTALNAVLEVLTEGLSKGEKIQLTGFGTFEVKEKPARKGRNPKTGEEMDIPASKSPKFKAGKSLKEAVK